MSPKQRGNPILGHIKHVLWREAPGLVPDYVLGKTTAAMYISLRYHSLNASYLWKRLKELGKPGAGEWRLRLVLVLVDVADTEKLLLDVTRMCVCEG